MRTRKTRRWGRELRAARYAFAAALVLLAAPILISALSESLGRTAASALVAFPPALAAAALFERRWAEAAPSGDLATHPSKPGEQRRRDLGPAQGAPDEHGRHAGADGR